MDLDATQPAVADISRKGSWPRQGSLKFALLWLCLFVLLSFGVYHLRYDLRSYSLLTHFLDPQASGPLLRWETYAVTTQEVTLPATGGPVRARLYLPSGLEQFHKSYSVLSAKKEAVAVGDGNGLEGNFAGQEQGVFRTGSKAAQGLLDFAPHRFDGVEIGGVRR